MYDTDQNDHWLALLAQEHAAMMHLLTEKFRDDRNFRWASIYQEYSANYALIARRFMGIEE